MEIRVRNLGEKKFVMEARKFKVFSDQPVNNGGSDTAMTPPELFLASLGACAAYYAEEYLKARGLPDEGLEIRIIGDKGDKPVRITAIEIEVVAPGLNQRHRDGILRAVDACLLKHTLEKLPDIKTKVISSADMTESVLELA